MFGLGFQEFALFAIVAVLLFGKRLPEVAKSFGQSYRQFRDGLNDIQRQMNVSDDIAARPYSYSDSVETNPDDYEKPTAPKFELPNLESQDENSTPESESSASRTDV